MFLYFRDRRSTASLRYRNRAEITIPKSPAPRSRVHARLASLAQIGELARRLSGIVWTLSYITTALPSVVHSVQQDLLLEYQVLLLQHLWLPNNELFHHENSAESTKYDRWSTLPHKRAYWAINFCWTFRLLCPTFGPISASLGVRSCSFQRREEVYGQVAQKSIPLVSSHHAHIIIAKRRSYHRLKNEIYYIHS